MSEVVCISFAFGLVIGLLIAVVIWRHMSKRIADLENILKTSIGEIANRGRQS